MQPVLKELMSVKGLILLIALVALGLSITAVVGGGCGSSFGDCNLYNQKTGKKLTDTKGLCYMKKDCQQSVDLGIECGNKTPIDKTLGDELFCKCDPNYGGGSGEKGPMSVCSKTEECQSGLTCTKVKAYGGDLQFCVPSATCSLKGNCENDKDCCRNYCPPGPKNHRGCGPFAPGDDDDNSPPPPSHPPSHPSGILPQGRKKSGGMIGGNGSILGGSPPTGGKTGGFVPNPPSPSPPGPPLPGTEGGVCGKIGLGNIKCKSSDLECKKKNTFPQPPTGTCVKKSPDIPISGSCGQTNAPCGSGEEDCCDNYECTPPPPGLLGNPTCQRKSPGPSPTGGLPEWAVYSLWSAGGVALIAIVIYLIMQMQSGKVN